MTIDEFVEELRLARLDAGRGVRAELRDNQIPGRGPLLRMPHEPGSEACDCPVTFLARSMGLLGGYDDWDYRRQGRELGLDWLALADIVAAADGNPALALLRGRLCAALGVEEPAAERAA